MGNKEITITAAKFHERATGAIAKKIREHLDGIENIAFMSIIADIIIGAVHIELFGLPEDSSTGEVKVDEQ